MFSTNSRVAILGINVRVTVKTKIKIYDHVKQSYNVKNEREILSYKLKGFVLRCWMGQSAEQSRDDFKDVHGEEDLSCPKYQIKFCAKAFFEVSSL